MWEESIVVAPREQTRAMVLNRLLEGVWTQREAAESLGLSERHVRRLQAAYRKEGIGALVHKNRGGKPRHTLPEEVHRRVVPGYSWQR